MYQRGEIVTLQDGQTVVIIAAFTDGCYLVQLYASQQKEHIEGESIVGLAK